MEPETRNELSENQAQQGDASAGIAAAQEGPGDLACLNSYMPKPQLAMPVVYRHPGAKGGGAPYLCAGIVTAVAPEGTLSILTFPPNMSGESISGVKYGEGVGQCSLPSWS